MVISGISVVPRGDGGRLWIILWIIMSLIIGIVYKGNLKAMLIAPKVINNSNN